VLLFKTELSINALIGTFLLSAREKNAILMIDSVEAERRGTWTRGTHLSLAAAFGHHDAPWRMLGAVRWPSDRHGAELRPAARQRIVGGLL